MTRHSFTEAIEQTVPRILTASHYGLAPDAYGLDDGYAWAFSEAARGEYVTNADAPADQNDPATGKPAANASTYYARHHLSDGGDWPYYIAATPSPAISRADDYTAAVGRTFLDTIDAQTEDTDGDPITAAELRAAIQEGRVLETYCEGDLTAYIFDTAAERETAAEAWGESGAEYAARILEGEGTYDYGNAEKLGAAVAACFADRSGEGSEYAEQITRDDVTETMDKHAGEHDTAADYFEETYDHAVESARETLDHSGALPFEVWSNMRPDWKRVADDAGGNGTGVTIYNGHAFHDN